MFETHIYLVRLSQGGYMSENRLILVILCLLGLGGCYYVHKHPFNFNRDVQQQQQNVQNWTPTPQQQPVQPNSPPKQNPIQPQKEPNCPNKG